MATRSTRERSGADYAPWVTFALVAACVCVYPLNQQATRQAQAVAEQRLQGAITYLDEHPYLEPGPILAERVDAGLIELHRQNARRSRILRGAPGIPQRVRQSQKQQLDQLVEQAFADVAALPVQRWGFRAKESNPLTLVTHVYLHERSSHLIGALFLLLILGFCLETTWGSGRFSVFVLLSSTASAVAFGIGNSDFPAPLIGMSGVVASLLGAFLIRLRSTWKHPVYPLAFVSGVLFLILPVYTENEWSVAAGFEQTVVLVGTQGATHWATGGGFAFGLLSQLAIALFGAGAAGSVGGVRGRADRTANSVLEKIDGARSAGRRSEAYETLAGLLRQNPDDYEALLLMWDVALDSGRPTEAAAAMLRAIRDEVKRDDAAAATEHWLDLANRGLDADAEPALLIRVALILRRNGHTVAAIQALQLALAKSEVTNAAVVASRVARASRDLDPETARAAAWRALGSVDLSLEERQNLELLLGEVGYGIDATSSELATGGAFIELGAESTAARFAPVPDAGDRLQPANLAPVEFADLVQVGDSPLESAAEAHNRLEPIDLDVVSRTLRAVAATPIALGRDELCIEVEGGAKKRLPLAKLEAISVAAVGGLGAKSVIVIDLVLNSRSASGDELRVIRLRGDFFDARAFAPDLLSPLDALRSFVAKLLRESGATPLPDEPSAKGMPFASFGDLNSYQSSVFGVEFEGGPS